MLLGAAPADAAALAGGGLQGSGDIPAGGSGDDGSGLSPPPSFMGDGSSDDEDGSCSGLGGSPATATAAAMTAGAAAAAAAVQKRQAAAAAAPVPAPSQAAAVQQRKVTTSGATAAAPQQAAAGVAQQQQQQQQPPVFRSGYRGVSYDKKKRKWRVQIKVAALGKSGVSVGYFDTEVAAARAYDRAAIGLLGRGSCRAVLNFPMDEYDDDSVPELIGKTRDEVKAALKSQRAKQPKRRPTSQRRTSKFIGVGASNRKNQWQARILVAGKVTHLGYHGTEEAAARVYDRVAVALNGAAAETNFPFAEYADEAASLAQRYGTLSREELQRALGVKPSDRSSRFRGVRQRRGLWEAKVPVNRRWAYREAFASEEAAARAFDSALWRLRPRGAAGVANFGNACCPADVAAALSRSNKDGQPIPLHSTGLPITAKPLLDAGLLFDDEGQSIKQSRHRLGRIVSKGELAAIGESPVASSSSDAAPSSAGPDGAASCATGGGGATTSSSPVTTTAGPTVPGTAAAAAAAAAAATAAMGRGQPSGGSIVDSASFTALSALQSSAAGTEGAAAGAAAGTFSSPGSGGGIPQYGSAISNGGGAAPLGSSGLMRAHSTPALPTHYGHSPLQRLPGGPPLLSSPLPQQQPSPLFLGPDAYAAAEPPLTTPHRPGGPLMAPPGGMLPQPLLHGPPAGAPRSLLIRVGSESHLIPSVPPPAAPHNSGGFVPGFPSVAAGGAAAPSGLLRTASDGRLFGVAFGGGLERGPLNNHQLHSHPSQHAAAATLPPFQSSPPDHPLHPNVHTPLGPAAAQRFAPPLPLLHRTHSVGGLLPAGAAGAPDHGLASGSSFGSNSGVLGGELPPSHNGSFTSLGSSGHANSLFLGASTPHLPGSSGPVAVAAPVGPQQQHGPMPHTLPRPGSPLLFAGGGFHIGGEDLGHPLQAYLSAGIDNGPAAGMMLDN